MAPLKIVHIITGLKRGGAETMLARLLPQTDKRDFVHEVIALTTFGAVGDDLAAAGIPVRALGLKSSCPWRFFTLVRWLRASRPDVVQTWLYHGDLLGGLAARLAGIGSLAWGIHHSNLDPAWNQKGILGLAWLGSRLSESIPARIVCCSESVRQAHVAWGYAPDKMWVIPNGFDVGRFRPDPAARREVRSELGLTPGAFLVGIFSRFHPLKDHKSFAAAAGELAREFPDLHFLLCGERIEVHNRELWEMLQSQGVIDRCHLLGLREDVPRLMAALDLLVLSSRGEAMPLSVGEAMACAVPCVATDVGDTAALIGSTGRIVPAGQPRLLAAAIREMIRLSETERAALGTAARQRIEQEFSLATTVAGYQAHFRWLGDRARTGRPHGEGVI